MTLRPFRPDRNRNEREGVGMLLLILLVAILAQNAFPSVGLWWIAAGSVLVVGTIWYLYIR